MQKFEYSFLLRLFYRYGNIPVTLLLAVYLILSAVNLDKSLINLFPFAVSAMLIFFLNRQYLRMYKIMPYKIEADNDKLVCMDFLFSQKEIVIFHKDISTLSGGIFDGKLSGIMKVTDNKNNISIGFFNNIKNVRGLQTIILSKVQRSVYDDVVDRIKKKKPQSNKQQTKNEKRKK